MIGSKDATYEGKKVISHTIIILFMSSAVTLNDTRDRQIDKRDRYKNWHGVIWT